MKGDIDLKYILKHETDKSFANKNNKKRESIWKELNGLLNEIYPNIAGSGISPSFMTSLAKMINNVILQIQGKRSGRKGNSPILKLGYWRSTLD